MTRRAFVLLAAAALLFGGGGGASGAATSFHKETGYGRADVTLYLFNDTAGNFLTGDNGTEERTLRLATGGLISTSLDFTLNYNGGNLSEDLNFTPGGRAAFTIWLKGSGRGTHSLRLGAEVGAEKGNLSCGKADGLVDVGADFEPHALAVPLTSSRLGQEENLRVTVSVDYVGMPLTLDILTGGNRSGVILPVENYARLVMDLEVNESQKAVAFSADALGPFRGAFYPRLCVRDYNLTGPTRPKDLLRAAVPDLRGIWRYGRDDAKNGRYVFEASYGLPSGQRLEDAITFEIRNGSGGGTGSQLPWVAAAMMIILLLILILVVVRKRRKA